MRNNTQNNTQNNTKTIQNLRLNKIEKNTKQKEYSKTCRVIGK